MPLAHLPTPRRGRTAAPPPVAVQPRDLMIGLAKGLAVIEAFDQALEPLTIADVARHCAITRAAARRCLITLQQLGFVHGDGRHFALSARVLRLGQSYLYSAQLPRVVQPALHKLSSALKEAASAGVLDGDDVICIAATSGARVVSATLQLGTRVPAYCTANGRVLLAALPPAELDAWLAHQALHALTPRTLTSVARLRSEVARVRAQGYACVDQELEPGLRTLAVPLLNARGDTLAAMNVSVQAVRVPVDQLIDQCLPALRQAQAALRAVL
jgi:IclR family transcriptional regulator, pca regulon regulatory protein